MIISTKTSRSLPRLVLLGGIGLGLLACQSSSQSSSSSMPSIPSASSSSSSSSQPSIPSASSSSSSSSRPSIPSASSSSASSSPGSASSRQSSSSSSSSQSSSSSGGQQQNQGSRANSFPSSSQGSSSQAQGSQTASGDQSGPASGRDGSTGDLGSGVQSNTSGGLGKPGGDYTLDTLPNGVLSGDGTSQTTAATTPGERAAVLDERLRRGYETFDGFILGERERAQAESNRAGSSAIGGDAGGGAGSAEAQAQTLPASGAPSGVLVAAQSAVSSAAEPNQSFPPPGDIPSGRDDDVVARQLREAAMSEPDPELREALWNEYRNYTGISEDQ